jgi:5-methylcytosine-specific restriction enzyme subunit McrC
LASEARRTALRMTEVTLIDPDVRMLGRVRIHRNNRFYGFLLSICRLILEATSVAESRDSLEAAEQQFYGVVEERLFDLFEMFVRNFYAKQLAGEGWTHFGRRHFEWQWEALTADAKSLLPRMETDITLEHPDRKIIMDTKFYGSGGISKDKFHSTNMYQLNSYVTQCSIRAHRAIAEGNAPAHPHDIDAEGMLLYATVDDNDFHHKYSMPPHTMAVATVNLSRDWRTIEARLLEVIE